MADLGKEEKVGGGCEKEEEESLIEGVAVLDFDMLCSTVAMQSQGKWRLFENEEEGEDVGGGGGVLRMWEGEVLDCFDDHRIAIETLCCPCYRFGKNMRRAGLGPCFLQGALCFILAMSVVLSCVAFIVTRRRCFLYLTIAFTMSVGTYLGFFRTQIRKKFNIRGSDNSVDDCVYHLICPCCTLCQESRTLEMNNVQGGTWHGRGDTICIGTVGEGRKAFVELHPPPIVSAEFHETNASPKGEEDLHNQC
ncbi:cell number regulator 13-like [Chenopodium quinoa]|uniref:cell number regulator 13-like n=1 Tax=Chenopodium quinoa TaxID=63459 RepID=UPI000B7784F0|nr:cell number regulator 13-like [Chenopodium quinoa]